jgi:predicted RNA-binding protein with PUA-like domain
VAETALSHHFVEVENSFKMKAANDYLPTEYWLMKSEPDTFSFNDLYSSKSQKEFWDGVRNYQARNFMRDHMKVGHTILFYHSNAQPTGISGIAKVVASATVDHSAFDKKSPYYDAKSSIEAPCWVGVTIGEPQHLKNFITLQSIKAEPSLSEMLLVRNGQRLSIQPVSPEEFSKLLYLGCKL